MMIINVCLFVAMALGFHIYFLQMIVSYFAGQTKGSAKKFLRSWLSMKED